jgi:hypothetical protein
MLPGQSSGGTWWHMRSRSLQGQAVLRLVLLMLAVLLLLLLTWSKGMWKLT